VVRGLISDVGMHSAYSRIDMERKYNGRDEQDAINLHPTSVHPVNPL